MQGQDAGGAQYTLVGVVEHAGRQLASGHYWAFVQRGLRSPNLPVPMADDDSPSQGPAPQSNCHDAKVGTRAPAVDDSWDDITAAVLSSPVKGRPTLPDMGLPAFGREHQNTLPASPEICAPTQKGDAQSAAAIIPARQSSPEWYHASDTHVSRLSQERVLAFEAYILLYMRVA